jgi:hypothetical protein
MKRAIRAVSLVLLMYAYIVLLNLFGINLVPR